MRLIDDRLFAYPKHFDVSDAESNPFLSHAEIPYVIDPKDLVSTIKSAHYSAVAQLTSNPNLTCLPESQLEEYKNKVGVIEGIMGL